MLVESSANSNLSFVEVDVLFRKRCYFLPVNPPTPTAADDNYLDCAAANIEVEMVLLELAFFLEADGEQFAAGVLLIICNC